MEQAFEEVVDDCVDSPAKSPGSDSLFCFETKHGGKYSPTIRKLYYSLLSVEISPAKIANIVREVLSCFFPDVDVSTLNLPSKTCAGYMRKEELKTISSAHQATVLSEANALHLNSDGTTKLQKKLTTAAMNGMGWCYL